MYEYQKPLENILNILSWKLPKEMINKKKWKKALARFAFDNQKK